MNPEPVNPENRSRTPADDPERMPGQTKIKHVAGCWYKIIACYTKKKTIILDHGKQATIKLLL